MYIVQVLPEPLSRPSSSFVPSSSDLVVILPPSGQMTPSPSTFGGVYRRCALRACGGVFLAVLAKTAKTTYKHYRPLRCLPRGSVFRAVFLNCFFLEFFLKKIKIYFLKKINFYFFILCKRGTVGLLYIDLM